MKQIFKVFDLSAGQWQPVGNLSSSRLNCILGEYKSTFHMHLCRQGLVLVENGEGALAMGGIDQQYQVSKRKHSRVL